MLNLFGSTLEGRQSVRASLQAYVPLEVHATVAGEVDCVPKLQAGATRRKLVARYTAVRLLDEHGFGQQASLNYGRTSKRINKSITKNFHF